MEKLSDHDITITSNTYGTSRKISPAKFVDYIHKHGADYVSEEYTSDYFSVKDLYKIQDIILDLEGLNHKIDLTTEGNVLLRDKTLVISDPIMIKYVSASPDSIVSKRYSKTSKIDLSNLFSIKDVSVINNTIANLNDEEAEKVANLIINKNKFEYVSKFCQFHPKFADLLNTHFQ